MRSNSIHIRTNHEKAQKHSVNLDKKATFQASENNSINVTKHGGRIEVILSFNKI